MDGQKVVLMGASTVALMAVVMAVVTVDLMVEPSGVSTVVVKVVQMAAVKVVR